MGRCPLALIKQSGNRGRRIPSLPPSVLVDSLPRYEWHRPRRIMSGPKKAGSQDADQIVVARTIRKVVVHSLPRMALLEAHIDERQKRGRSTASSIGRGIDRESVKALI